LNVSATNIMSKCRIASIELDDAVILGRVANPDGSNFRKGHAILESVSSRPTGYAIAFDRDAAGQRATLDVADRIELADLVAQLSIAGMLLEQREGMQRDKTQNNRVEIDYVIDNASRSIRVTALRRVREVSDASVSGASHA
jgi:hypothetical protein